MSAMRSGMLLATLAALATLLGCHSVPKPPTPVLAGPDTGWTHVATAFEATSAYPPDDEITAATYFDWGDNSTTGGYTMGLPYEHIYAEPGTYVVKCRFLYTRQHLDWFTTRSRYGDWSNPCTVHIVPCTGGKEGKEGHWGC